MILWVQFSNLLKLFFDNRIQYVSTNENISIGQLNFGSPEFSFRADLVYRINKRF